MKKLLLLCSLLTVLISASAQTGNSGLDPSFAKNGILIDTSYSPYIIVTDLKLQSDGKIIVCSSGYYGAYIARYLQNGTVDSSFGNKGSRFIDAFAKPKLLSSTTCELQPDGKILLAGEAYRAGGYLMRLNSNGSLDSAFGNNGVQTMSSTIGRLCLRLDGKIITAGIDNDQYLAVRRLTQSGIIDSTFGTNGASLVKVYTLGSISIAGMGRLADGRIAVIGGNTDNVFSIRLDSNGVRDPSLCGTGLCYTVGATYNKDAIIYPDGRALVATGGLFADNTTFLIRLKSDTTPDSTFSIDQDGVLTVPGLRTNRLLQIADGRIICAGYWNEHFAVARVLKDGQGMDTSFGNKGIMITSVAGGIRERINALILQLDGKILAGGHCLSPERYNKGYPPSAAMVRYLPDAPLAIGKVPYTSTGILKVYPNPASTLVTVMTPVSGTLQLYSSEGRLLRQQHCVGPVQSLDIASLPNGTYLLRLLKADKSYSSLFVKE